MKRGFMKKFFVAAVFVFFTAAMASAEYFYMKSGEVINGKILSETSDSVTVSVSGTKKKLMIKDIDEITAKPRSTAAAAETVKVDYDEKTAKSQFTSAAKQDLPDSKTYVSENKSGIIVYNVKETELKVGTEIKTQDQSQSAPAASIPAAQASDGQPQPLGNDEFDAAAYLLSGGEPSAAKPAVYTEQPAKATATDETAPTPDNNNQPSSQEQPQPQPQEQQLPVKMDNSDDSDYDPTKYLIDDNAKQKKSGPVSSKPQEETVPSSVPSNKPSGETILAIALDLKGTNKFSGAVTQAGVRQSADLTESTDYGVSILAERYGYLSRYAALGLGVGYQFGRCLEKSPGRFGFLPVYAAFKMRVLSGEDYYLYGVVHLGYGFIVPNSAYRNGADSTEGGLYCAGGAGISYNRYVFQALYSANYAHITGSNSYTGDNINKDAVYSKVGLYLGYLI